ncbi:MAG: Ribosomal RNA large subunit methyltransferase H [Firmicutes bacterium ADurb.Bin193]|nr:MAG: Ribosomal RNA large subunit methyltransferase H [Firmicutes bacterium ADurb.Bin193]
MITVEIIAVGKIKEDYYNKAVSEYIKRLSRYCNLKISEVSDFPDDKNSVQKEEALILPRLRGVCVPLCVEGKQMSSEDLAGFISDCAVSGRGHITFVIGGSNGLGDRVKNAGELKLSFSKLTFPHRLMRVMLLEQIYRAFKIISGESYHK